MEGHDAAEDFPETVESFMNNMNQVSLKLIRSTQFLL
jgi:hypothetical protein